MWRILAAALAAAGTVGAASQVWSVEDHVVYVEIMLVHDTPVVECHVDAVIVGVTAPCAPVLVSPPGGTGPWIPTGHVHILDGVPASEVVSPGERGPVTGLVLAVPAGYSVAIPFMDSVQVLPWPGRAA